MATNTNNIWTNEKDGILTVQELAFNILTDMTAPAAPGIAGFTIKAGVSNGTDVSSLPATYANAGGTPLFLPNLGTNSAVPTGFAEFVLEPTIQVDMLAAAQGSIAKQLYRIYMQISVAFINVVLGTDTQITVIPSGTTTTTTVNVTATTATTNIITATNHGLTAGQTITFATATGGLATGTTYYVISSGLTTNAFEVSTSSGGTAVALTTGTTASVGTATNVTTSATISVAKDKTAAGYNFYPGLVGVTGSATAVDEYFIDRYDVNNSGSGNIAGVESSHPMSYRISYAQNSSTTFGANGFALCVWEPGNDAGTDSSNVLGCKHSWLVVQRSVDNTTGQVAVTSTPPLTAAGLTGKLPVYCFYRIYRAQDIFTTDATGPLGQKLPVCVLNKLIIRESDITRQSTTTDASLSTADNYANVPNCGSIDTSKTPVYQSSSSIVSLLEDGSYNVNLVSGLNTSRFSYPKNELDLIGFTSADVVSTGQTITFTAYGESTPRQYFTLVSTGANNTGIRFFIRVA